MNQNDIYIKDLLEKMNKTREDARTEQVFNQCCTVLWKLSIIEVEDGNKDLAIIVQSKLFDEEVKKYIRAIKFGERQMYNTPDDQVGPPKENKFAGLFSYLKKK